MCLSVSIYPADTCLLSWKIQAHHISNVWTHSHMHFDDVADKSCLLVLYGSRQVTFKSLHQCTRCGSDSPRWLFPLAVSLCTWSSCLFSVTFIRGPATGKELAFRFLLRPSLPCAGNYKIGDLPFWEWRRGSSSHPDGRLAWLRFWCVSVCV